MGEAKPAGRESKVGFLVSGARARSRQGRARQRRGGSRRDSATCYSGVRGAEREVRRADGRRRDERRCSRSRASLQDKIDAVDGWELDRTLEVAMDALRCPPGDADVSHLSGGERRRVALCRLLLSKPDMLLLDEPTNHLDAESVAWLERFLQEYPGTVVAVTHDRYFLDNVAGWILELDRGRGIPWKGNYSSWLEQKSKRLEVEEKQARATGPHARARARVDQHERPARARPRARRASTPTSSCSPRSKERAPENKVEIAIPIPAPGRRGGRGRGSRKAFGDKLLFDDLDFEPSAGRHRRSDRRQRRRQDDALRMIVGEEKPDAGSSALGETVELAYVDQSASALDAEKTVWEVISGGEDRIQVGRREMPSRAYVSSFNFKGADQQKLVGDRSRAASATACTSPSCSRGRQRPAARRAHQRPRRRHPARPRRRAGDFPAAPW